MTEAFLHYLWLHRLFKSNTLISDEGSKVEILKSGNYNTGAGPDFFNALLRIDGMLWAGNVEIHINSSDWNRHNHQHDPAYDSCILHVVYNNDTPTVRINGSRIPTIEIKDLYSSYLWDNYLHLIGTQEWIPCQKRLKEINEQTLKRTIDLMIEERMESRCDQVLIALRGNKDDWQETFYQHLARNFGFQINAIPFEMVARSLPGKIILKERKNLSSIEALMFGQAGMLQQDFSENYPKQLQNEYMYFRNKYNLQNIPFASWKFMMRLRPVNFPTIRLAQFSSLIHESPVMFNEIINANNLELIIEMFDVTTSSYWDTHYRFETSSTEKIKRLGINSINNLLINSCIPFIYAWGKYSGDKSYTDRAMSFLSECPPEENHIITGWKNVGVKVNNAVESQALLHLKILHCSEKKCLTCHIGKTLINLLP